VYVFVTLSLVELEAKFPAPEEASCSTLTDKLCSHDFVRELLSDVVREVVYANDRAPFE